MSARSSLNFPNNFTQVPINISASGNSTLIAGAAGKQVKVFRMKLTVGAATIVQIKDSAGTVLDNLDFASVFGMVLDFTTIDMPPWYTSGVGKDLVLNSTNAVQLSGNVDYLLS